MAEIDGFAAFISDQFDGLEGFSIKKMMGGYVMHYLGRVLGFVFDDKVLLEDGPTAKKLLPDAAREPLFPGSKDFVIFEDYQNGRYMRQIAVSLYEDLPISKPRKSDRSSRSAKGAGVPDVQSFKDFYKKG